MDGMDKVAKETGEFRQASAYIVTVGTNGYHGGDAGHGSRTYFQLHSDGADVEIRIDNDGRDVTIEMGGDSELSTFIEAMEFAVDTLKRQSGYVPADR
jgi:hypothetical protein